jgi:hypothetical protein
VVGLDVHTETDLLTSLGARFELNEESDGDEENLKSWSAWDEASPAPYAVFHLWIHNDDLSVVGTKIVEMFPERLYDA